jgi:DNA polymerase III subunit delta
MIKKNYEIEKLNQNFNYFLFYGKNEGLKNETIIKLNHKKKEILNYDEKEVLENQSFFIEKVLSKSLFDEDKIIVIKRATDKIVKLIDELNTRNIEETIIIIIADNLDKKSKLRLLFEKDNRMVCVPFYPDNEQVLSKLAYNFLQDRKISMSPSNLNMIINKCGGERETLINELQKIEYFSKNGKKINTEIISKLINLNENHSISELIDNCLAKNKKKIISILNENNFSNDDCVMITRSFLIKAKKLLALSTTFETNKNIELTISSAKPPIFWKEKEITKQQIYKWESKNIKQLIYALGETELQIKKNINNSINLITDFILLQSSSATSN